MTADTASHVVPCDLADLDRAALTACIEIVSRDPERAEQLAAMQQQHGCSWLDASKLAASYAQSDALRLQPWETPPCDLPPDGPGARLLARMLAAGVSRYAPDPLAELAQVERPRAPSDGPPDGPPAERIGPPEGEA